MKQDSLGGGGNMCLLTILIKWNFSGPIYVWSDVSNQEKNAFKYGVYEHLLGNQAVPLYSILYVFFQAIH